MITPKFTTDVYNDYFSSHMDHSHTEQALREYLKFFEAKLLHGRYHPAYTGRYYIMNHGDNADQMRSDCTTLIEYFKTLISVETQTMQEQNANQEQTHNAHLPNYGRF